MSRKIIFFINPISGVKNKGALLKTINQKAQQQHIHFEIMHTNASGDYSFLKEKIEKEKITDVVICGGDGSVNHVTRALMNIDINVGIVPMGSGNGLAFAAKIPRQASKALDIIFSGKASYIDAFFINEHFSCMLSGLGLDAQIAHAFAKQKKRGLLTYIKQSFAAFLKITPYVFALTINEETFTSKAYFISIANSNQFGNNVTIAPMASLNDGLLDIVIAKKTNKLAILIDLFGHILVGKARLPGEKKSSKKNVLYFQTDKLTITNLSAAPLHIDGEPAQTAEKFVIEIIPNAFRLIQPQ